MTTADTGKPDRGRCAACGQELLRTIDDCWHPHDVERACPPEVTSDDNPVLHIEWGDGFGRPGRAQWRPLAEAVACAVGCGMCCDPVHLHFPLTSITRWSSEAIQGLPDPATDDGWAAWQAEGWQDDDRDYVKHQMSPLADRRNANFAAVHWHELLGPEREADFIPVKDGEVRMRRIHCDAFDPHTRSCTVWDVPSEDGGQPPVCSEYPRYGGPPGSEHGNYGNGMSPACSFNADVRTFLPIIEVRSSR